MKASQCVLCVYGTGLLGKCLCECLTLCSVCVEQVYSGSVCVNVAQCVLCVWNRFTEEVSM